MSNLPEQPAWESGIHQLEESERAKAGPGGVLNIQALQLANRTNWLRILVESASDYREYTFYKTESDPDGTIAGTGNTPAGKLFRVVYGAGDSISFTYYLNDSGTAVRMASLPGQGFIDLISAQVAAEITARLNLIDLMPPAWSKYLAVIKDANGREAWGIDKINGSPTDYTIALWMQKMEETKVLPVLRNIPGYGLVFTMPDPDGEERFTDLAIRSSDGQFADFVMLRWADRLVPLLQGRLDVATRPTPAGTWKHPSGDYVPYVTDLRTIVGVGSSSTNRSNSTYTTMSSGLGAAYVNMGVEGGIIAQNAAHIGAVPALITVSGGSIPASGGVAVTASNIPSSGINMAMGGTLAGVAGSIAWSNGNTGTFTRSASGAAVAVPPNTPFIPNSARYRANQIILESGKNDINQGRDAALILSMTHQIVEWLAPFLSTTIVMGHFNNHNYSDTAKARLATVNSGIVSAYGDRAIDQQAWLVSATIWDQLAAEGITPTAQDLTDQANGLPPTQLMIAAKDHLTPAAYGYRMKYLVRPKLIELGLYKETN